MLESGKMGKRKDLSNFDKGQIVAARPAVPKPGPQGTPVLHV